MTYRIALLVVALLSVTFAGCSGGAAKETPASPSAVVVAPGEQVPDAASLLVTVLDDEARPLAGAEVSLLEANVRAITAETGMARIDNLAPATYTLAAARLGYESLLRKITLEPNAEQTTIVTLEPIKVEEQFSRTLGPFRQFLNCRLSHVGVPLLLATTSGSCNKGVAGVYPLETPLETAFGKSNNSISFQMEAENLHAVVGETKWQPSAYGTSNRLQTILSYEGRSGSHWWCAAAGASPIKFVYSVDEEVEKCSSKGSSDEPEAPLMKHKLLVFSGLEFVSLTGSDPRPADVSVQQYVDTVITLFYGSQPAPDFSALPDA